MATELNFHPQSFFYQHTVGRLRFSLGQPVSDFSYQGLRPKKRNPHTESVCKQAGLILSQFLAQRGICLMLSDLHVAALHT